MLVAKRPYLDVEFYVGPWVSRLVVGSGGRFGWFEGQNTLIRFIRRWWSGWHRWDNDIE